MLIGVPAGAYDQGGPDEQAGLVEIRDIPEAGVAFGAQAAVANPLFRETIGFLMAFSN